jgi:hypothetical protein
LHVCSRSTILELRDEIFRIHGYQVVSTLFIPEALTLFRRHPFALVLIDVEGEGRVAQAEKLCGDIRDEQPEQKIAFVCNYRVAIESDCPDEVIRSEFNPEALVRGVKEIIE